MLLLVKLALASYPYIGHDTFCTDVSPIGWSCKEKVAIADAWTDPDVPGAVTAADGAADGVTALSLSAESFNTCPGAPVGPATNLVNDLCGTAAECGAGQALPFGQQWSSCGGASIVDNTGLIGALEAYGTADTILPTRPQPAPGDTVRQAICPYLHTPGWVPWKNQPPTPQQARLDQEDRCFFLACHQCQVVKTLKAFAGCPGISSVSAVDDNTCEKYWWRQLGTAATSDGGLSAANDPLNTMTKHETPGEKKQFVTFEPLITEFFGSCPMSAPTDRDGKTGAPRAASRSPPRARPSPPLAHA
jgi:hypothetical protein